eukprot:1007054-Rhodomonas_salina.1
MVFSAGYPGTRYISFFEVTARKSLGARVPVPRYPGYRVPGYPGTLGACTPGYTCMHLVITWSRARSWDKPFKLFLKAQSLYIASRNSYSGTPGIRVPGYPGMGLRIADRRVTPMHKRLKPTLKWDP